jgi:hypothetical protein
MEAVPRFLQGLFPFKRAQLIYLRAGNSSGELVYLLLTRDGKPMRSVPVLEI